MSAAALATAPAILVIDDSDVDRLAIMEVLESAGFEVHGLPSPIGATREVKLRKAALVLIDQNMPVMDGSKLTRLFRENAAMAGVKLVLISGNDDEAMRQTAREVRADAFVSKSQMHGALVRTVRNLLGL